MKSTDVVGKKIVQVIQKRWHNEQLGKCEYDVTLILEDGTRIYATAIETEVGPAARMHAIPPRQSDVVLSIDGREVELSLDKNP